MLRHRPSGVAVLSPTESGGSSGSDITEPASPRSPESSGSTAEEGAGARMPPWASDPAPPAPRRIAAQPAPVRRPHLPIHRRITEYFNHKMKPQNGLKRDSSVSGNDDTKRKCLPKNGVTHDLEKYISYISQTLSPKVLMDVGKQAEVTKKAMHPTNGVTDTGKPTDLSKTTSAPNFNGMIEYNRPKDIREKNGIHSYGLAGVPADSHSKEKHVNGIINGLIDAKKQVLDMKTTTDPSANTVVSMNVQNVSMNKKHKVPISKDSNGLRIAPATSANQSPNKKMCVSKSDSSRVNGVVSSTTKLDSKMNGVMCGSNNLSLNPISSKVSTTKKEPVKRTAQPTKRTNRKSSACIANSKNLTWSKANNLKQVQLQQQNCFNSSQNPSMTMPGEANSAPKMNIPNGVRQVSMTMNGSLGNLNVPVTNLQNCHQLNIPQPCNGTVTSSNLASFVAVPQNVMLTALRIPQNGLSAQTINHQQNNMTAFNRPNVNVSSPTKLNGQFVFPFMQNINGTVVQIPNLMAKVPNFVLPQTPQLTTQRQDHLQNQQAAQILINGTLLKLTNTIPPTYPNVNKPSPVTSQSIPVMNKNAPGMPPAGITVQSKPNFAVNFSHPVLVPQPGYIVTSVPNINVKETWSYSSTNTASSSQPTCSNPIVHHPPPVVPSFPTQALHTSSIPIAPVKPPDNPIQGTDPPSSTVKEPEANEVSQKLSDVSPKLNDVSAKCDIPWLSKTVNNNIVQLDTNKLTSRPFAHVNSLSEKLEDLAAEKSKECKMSEEFRKEIRIEHTEAELRKVEEVARREETIFTQITVLKDVSSNVQSTLIEANFCSTTTESSESGIGTDKSIDSPSDSQTSKECDEDSSLSLSVSVCSVEAHSSQKSPILKQPKTLRFPPKNLTKSDSDRRTSSTDTTSTVTLCQWENCKREFESDSDLLEHLQADHVETQAGKENYVCLWQKCKVRGKPSCSRLWLERHALSHGGNKPFKCIVDGCGRRFSTQILLERHVNNHFNEVSPSAGSKSKSSDSANKLIRRNGKKLRYRRQPWSARMFDFFDAGTMEGLAWRLSLSSRWRLAARCPLREARGRHALTLVAVLRAARYNAAERRREALVAYFPPHVIEDEWVPEKDVKRFKRVDIASLPVHTKVVVYEQFCASYKMKSEPPPPPPAVAPPPPPPPPPSPPQRLLPARNCTSSRILSNLIAKQKRERVECSTGNISALYREEETSKPEVSGAKKRKMGRRYGGNSFWPCGR
ncbi:zinc finger protein jing homolog isoform X2 [Plodia interpunctella]|uniref:zinc finger protein jing homolog isoform X2 n=1 Tax=Plodia interpunctella TaxID=58824 RepID=UPI002367D8EC|nr:zinc finger protein jing homolog isoform X2 [Plodia interpunctella]